MNCAICLEESTKNWKCKQCLQPHCRVCHKKIISGKCPFCYAYFRKSRYIYTNEPYY